MKTAPRVALIAFDPWEGMGSFRPFNFAVRRVQASLLTRSEGDVEVHLVEARLAHLDQDAFAARIDAIAPDILAASAYVWSFPSLLETVERARARWPKATIVLGGPSAHPAVFELPAYRDRRFAVDALVLGEENGALHRIASLSVRSRDALAAVPGLALPSAAGWELTAKSVLADDLDSTPSPYALGLAPTGASASFETFRGCPLACSFCAWGAEGKRRFSQEYLERELGAIAEHASSSVALLLDAGLNLNAQAFRNLRHAEKATGTLRRLGLNFSVYPSDLHPEHVEFIAEVQGSQPARVCLGLQSFDPTVLTNMNRPFDDRRFHKVAQLLKETGCAVDVEVICGLPGDSPESFRQTIERVLELGCDVRVYPCLVLPEALMTRAPAWADMTYDPSSLLMRSCSGWPEAALRETWAFLDEHGRQESLSGDNRRGEVRVSTSWSLKSAGRA